MTLDQLNKGLTKFKKDWGQWPNVAYVGKQEMLEFKAMAYHPIYNPKQQIEKFETLIGLQLVEVDRESYCGLTFEIEPRENLPKDLKIKEPPSHPLTNIFK